MSQAIAGNCSINYSLGDISVSLTGSYKHQSLDHVVSADNFIEKDGSGNSFIKVWADIGREEMTFESIPIATATGSLSASLVKIPPGTNFSCSSTTHGPEVAGTNWYVDEWSSKRSNVGTTKITIKAWRHSNIS